MKILEIRTLRGPNYWSITRHRLIAMMLDLEELEHRPTDRIDGFAARLEALFPSLVEHKCSRGHRGGFFERVREGTWMGHVIEHIALELQTLAGMEVEFGQTRGTGTPGVYNVVFSYVEPEAGRYAAHAAFGIAQKLIDGESCDIDNDIRTLRELRDREKFGPSTAAIVEEARRRSIPYFRLNDASLLQLGYGIHQKRIEATTTGHTSAVGMSIACDKGETKQQLHAAGIPVPAGVIISSEEDIDEAIQQLGFPLAIKPLDGNHGRGACTNITHRECAHRAFHIAREETANGKVIVERYIRGNDYRLLVVNHRLVAAAHRVPPSVTGNGADTIRQLVDRLNEDPRRGNGHDNVMTRVSIDDITQKILDEHGLTADSVLPFGQRLMLKGTANISSGGMARDVTDLVHPFNVFLAERVSRIVGLDICGIDIIAPDIAAPLTENGGAVIEVNAGPGLRMHLAPAEGLARNVAEPILDMLFPGEAPSRIPIVAITGTNGKTTTTRLIAHIAKMAGKMTGYTTTDGIYIDGHRIQKGDCTGPASGECVLRDPAVDFAVLECARGGLLRAGLAFDTCDIGIVTNVAADHLGLNGIQSLEDMARVKSVIPETVSREGTAILNADDDLVYAMREKVAGRIALFSMDPGNPRILEHCRQGGIAAVVEHNYITICKGTWKVHVERVRDIPLTFGGKAGFMVQNVLAAVLAAYVQKFSLTDIRRALLSFIPSPEQTPGRMNMIRFSNFNVMVDYAHNPAGFRALGSFLGLMEVTRKTGIITGVGDRRDEDIIELGRLSATMFDDIIIRLDKDLRGRSSDEMVALLLQGIRSEHPDKSATVIPNIDDAVRAAVTGAPDGSLIVVCCEKVEPTLELVRRCRDEEELLRRRSSAGSTGRQFAAEAGAANGQNVLRTNGIHAGRH